LAVCPFGVVDSERADDVQDRSRRRADRGDPLAPDLTIATPRFRRPPGVRADSDPRLARSPLAVLSIHADTVSCGPSVAGPAETLAHGSGGGRLQWWLARDVR
jgi:hypothetical protein